MSERTVVTVGNFVVSVILGAIGSYDATHQLAGYGIMELWLSGGCFVAGLHMLSARRRRPTPTQPQGEVRGE